MYWINKIALRYFFSAKQDKFVNITTKIAIFAISFSIAMLIVSMSVIRGFETTMLNRFLQANGHIALHKREAYDPKEILSTIRKRYPLKAEPIVESSGAIVKYGVSDFIIFKGDDNFDKLCDIDEFKKGDNQTNVVIGCKLAEYYDIKVGDTITTILPINNPEPFGIIPEIIELNVCGIAKFDSHDLNRFGVLTRKKDAQQILGLEDKVNKIICFAADHKTALKYINPIQKDLPNVFVRSWKDMNMSFIDVMRVQRNLAMIILFVIIFLASIAVSASLILLIHAKKREIGILTMHNATTNHLVNIFFRVGLLIYLLSCVIGVCIGLIMVDHIKNILNFLSFFKINIFDSDVYLLPSIPTYVAVSDVIMIIFISFLITMIISLFTAYKFTKINMFESGT